MLALLLSNTASAQKPYTYEPTGPVTILTNDDQGIGFVTITNHTNTNLKLNIQFIGDSNFTYAYKNWPNVWIGADSAAGFPVYYRAWGGDTSYGFMRIYDSVNAPDTIHFIGIDTSDNTLPPWEQILYRSWAGNYYGGNTDTAIVSVYNHMNDTVTISASFAMNDGFQAIAPQSRTIAGNSTGYFRYLFRPVNDTIGDAVINLSGAGITDTARIHGRNRVVVPPRDSLYWHWQYSFDTVQPGDTVCQSIYIINPFDSSASITSFSAPSNSPFYLIDPPTLPMTLEGHDTLVLTVCYRSPNIGHQTSNSYITVQYQFAGDSSQSREIILRGSTAQCFAFSPWYLQFNVLRDSVQTQGVQVINRTGSTITLDADFDQAGGGHFEVLTSMPINIAAYDSEMVYVRFTATGATGQYAKLIFNGGTGCGTEDLALAAHIIDTNIVIDSTAIGLFADETRELDFYGDSNHTSITYRFYNDQGDSIKVVSISLKDGTHFTITDVAPQMPWFKLGPNGLMEVTIEFDGTPGTYTDTLVIVTEDGIIALNFPIHAVITSSAVAAPIVSAPNMIITPNPSTGPVTIRIEDAATATIDVLDIIGARIARYTSSQATFDRTDLAAGTYFVRASGIGEDRKPFVITQRLVLK